METFIHRLANGLRLVVVPMPHLHSVEMVCYVGAGGRNESPKTAGISHMLEHMLFRGNSAYPDSLALERAFEAAGGGANASTDVETTCYYSRIHPEKIADGVRLFSHLLRTPLWRDLELERRVILEEAREDLNEKGEIIDPDTLTNALLWPDSPLGQPLIGTQQTLHALSAADLADYHQAFYTPDNTVVVMAGRVEPAKALDAVARVFTDWRGACRRTPTPVPVPPRGPFSTWVRDSDSQVSLQLALRLPWGRHHDHAPALRLWRRILSWGGGSRLMLRLREELGLTYHVEANLHLLADTGSLTIDLSVQPGNLVQAFAEILVLLRQMTDEVVSGEELERIVQGYRYDLDYSRDLPEEMAVRYGWGELVGFRRDIDEDLARACAVTPELLQQVAREVVDPSSMALAVVGPWTLPQRRKMEKLLVSFPS